MGLISAIGYKVRERLSRDKTVARCRNMHELKEVDVAAGVCPTCGTNLFPDKGPLPPEESLR